ncbi:SCO family protein [Paenisporosarcina sp. TG20]|uniref:SCO family protein n=1 Tax=Paenisporosarcina sp. TG20 TaxID=1211706 RepID=UPI00030A8FBD|nr:SCO family protein [Paenisporosarcina sp. TG20]
MKRFVTVLIVGFGVMALLFFHPQSIDLPKLGTVKEWTLTEVRGEDPSVLEKPKLVTFFYTNCPDICPTTMFDLKDLQQLMKEKGVSEDQYLIVSVTVDPTYDSKERIIQYKNALDISSTNWLFLRGSEEKTKKFTKYFNFYYDKNQDGFLTHSTTMYMVDSHDQIRARHDMSIGGKKVNIKEVADHLQQLIEVSR